MIIEIAEIHIRPEERAAFIEAITRATSTVLSQARGYRRHAVFACQETPGRFVLQVEWATLEDHTVGFRESPAFAQWRAIIGPFFAQPPQVEHFDLVDGNA
jgi:heme-degrading monooxygenase HmoA